MLTSYSKVVESSSIVVGRVSYTLAKLSLPIGVELY